MLHSSSADEDQFLSIREKFLKKSTDTKKEKKSKDDEGKKPKKSRKQKERDSDEDEDADGEGWSSPKKLVKFHGILFSRNFILTKIIFCRLGIGTKTWSCGKTKNV